MNCGCPGAAVTGKKAKDLAGAMFGTTRALSRTSIQKVENPQEDIISFQCITICL